MSTHGRRLEAELDFTNARVARQLELPPPALLGGIGAKLPVLV
jgi:hypothetical protein